MSKKKWSSDSLIVDPIIFYKNIYHVFHTGESMVHGPAHLNFWLPYFKDVLENTLILIRNKDLFYWVSEKYPRCHVAYAKEYLDIDQLLPNFKFLSHMYYSSNTGNTIHTLKYNEITHVFLGHGDSDKSASAHKYFRVYDEIWVSGQAHIDRFKNAGFNVDLMTFKKVGRPPLRNILKNNKIDWRDRMELSVLYLPTWEGVYEESNYSSIHLSSELLQSIRALTETAQISAKFHPVTGSRDTQYSTLPMNLSQQLTSQNIKVVDKEVSVSELVAKSNIFICDISAVVSECLAADCPIFVYLPKDKNIVIAQSDISYEDYCYTFSDIAEFKNLFTKVILYGDDYLSVQRKNAIQYIISEFETENLVFEQLLAEISLNSVQKVNLLSVNRQ